MKRKNPATAVDSEEYETYANHPDANTYDENPNDRTEWADEDERVY